MLTYCFESPYVARTLSVSKKSDLAVVDTEGYEKAVREAVRRGVWVYGYLNIGVIKKDYSYFAVAISELPVHAAIMFTSDGVPVMHQKYTHVIVQEEVEPEEETPADGE